MLGLFPKLDLPPDARRTFRFHLAFALFDAACGGLLLNAPFVALREISAANWQLPLRDLLAGVGMLPALYFGSRMAARRKMPFVLVPGVLACTGAIAMAAALLAGSPFWLLLFFGLGAMLDITTRPAITAILRENYPVAQRGRVTATVRQWSSLCFVAVNLSGAGILSHLAHAGQHVKTVAAAEMALAAILGLTGYLCFRKIPIRANTPAVPPKARLEIVKNLREAAAVVVRDDRYRRFLIGCLMEILFLMLYLPMVSALLSTTLQLDYLWCAILLHGIPTLTAFAATGLLGLWFDRTNPWVSWACVRFAFGLDALLLAATPWAASLLPVMAILLPVLGRLTRGSVQGGWWVLWWQIGVTHFAPPGEDTSRYMGILVFLGGVSKITGAAAGMALAAMHLQPETLLWIGGLGVIATGFYSLAQAARERKQRRPNTFAEFEAQFGSQ